MSEFESEILGPLILVGGIGGGTIDTQTELLGKIVDVHIEIDFPQRLDDSVVQSIDLMLGNFLFVDELARDTIAHGLKIDTSSASRAYRAWKQAANESPFTTLAFITGLTPIRVSLYPDGGNTNPVRIAVTYATNLPSVSATMDVRFVSRSGPELSPVRS